MPQEGEIIVIPAGQVILLDITTPVLAVLIVDGGKFIWDRKDGTVTLDCLVELAEIAREWEFFFRLIFGHKASWADPLGNLNGRNPLDDSLFL